MVSIKAKLGRTSSHRRALLRNLVTSLIKHERILVTTAVLLLSSTTLPKAKALKRVADKMVTLGKQGDLAARRRALAYVMEPAVVNKLFTVLGPRFITRPGGYTRIQRTQKRQNDNADMAFISYLSANEPSPAQRAIKRAQRRKEQEESQLLQSTNEQTTA